MLKKLKKYLILFLLLIIISIPVKAEEIKYPDITEDVEVRYKWYKEIISETGKYYPLRKIKDGDRYDKDNYKFVRSSSINEESCSYPNEFYLIERKSYKRYKKIEDAKYAVIENVTPQTEIIIHYESRVLNYKIISNENNTIIIDLNGEKFCDKLMFYINTDSKYKISLYKDSTLQKIIIAREFENQKISIPDHTWLLETTQYYNTSYTTLTYHTSALTVLIGRTEMCAAHEKQVYKYDVTKEYYDNNYHAFVDGYIKDENDYRFYYKGEPIVVTNTIEVTKEKIKEVPKIEYVYVEKEEIVEENKEESDEKCLKEIHTVETKFIEKENNKIPKKVYLIISSLMLIIIIFFIKEIVAKCKIN